MLRHTTHDTPFDHYRSRYFTVVHTPRRLRHAANPTSPALSYTHADLPTTHASIFRLRMSPFGPRDPPCLTAGYQPAGYYCVKTAHCSGRIVPAGCSMHQKTEAWPPPQVRDSTDTPLLWECVNRISTTEHANESQPPRVHKLRYPGSYVPCIAWALPLAK